LQPSGDIDEDKIKALQIELGKKKPRKDIVLPLLKETFPERRQFVLTTQVSVAELTERYKSFLLPYAVSVNSNYVSIHYLPYNIYEA
jgi:hypothetical protein